MTQTSFVIIGLAGAGKTTFCKMLHEWLTAEAATCKTTGQAVATINLDPVVLNPKVPLDYDIRNKVDFAAMMKRYAFGPNACVNTCLNFGLMEMPVFSDSRYVIVDTPGQIEAFVWGSPGELLMKSLDNVCILFIVDSSLCDNKQLFLNNLIFAASLKATFHCPVLLVFTKSDISANSQIPDWIRSFESFRAACQEDESNISSTILYFEEFYKDMDFIMASSAKGEGKDAFIEWYRGVFSQLKLSDSLDKPFSTSSAK